MSAGVPRPLGFPRLAPSPPQRRYVTLNDTLRAAFGERVAKIALDGGYTCPNRDGTLAAGGCAYCGEGSRGLIARAGSLRRQFAAARALRKETKFVAYFQAYSGTYAPAAVLREHWREAMAADGAVALAISTRPDCLPDDVVNELAHWAARVPLWVELGLECADDATLRRLNRGHDVAAFIAAVELLARHGIAVAAHLIAGLPQEPPAALARGIRLLRRLPLWGLKIHPFHVVAGAPLARVYARGRHPLTSRATYVAAVAEALALADPQWVIHRLTGAAPGARHVAPRWAVQPRKLLNAIDAELARCAITQGCAATAEPFPEYAMAAS